MTTSAVTLIDRIAATIAHYKKYLCINEEKDRVSHQLHVQEVNAQAANWTREPLTCTKHNEPMFQIIFKTPEHEKGEWICHSCQDEKRLFQAELDRLSLPIVSKLPDYHAGQRVQSYHAALEQAIAHATAPDISKLATIKPTQHFIPQANIVTAPLPARDIVYAPTPLDDGDATEHRLPAIKLSRATKQIPAIGAEVLLMSIKNAPTHEQSTGEQERINEDAFLL